MNRVNIDKAILNDFKSDIHPLTIQDNSPEVTNEQIILMAIRICELDLYYNSMNEENKNFALMNTIVWIRNNILPILYK